MKRVVLMCLALLVSASAVADEGMWTFDNIPRMEIKARCGVDISGPWLDHLRLSTVRVGSGCTGSFVSPDGLILTNHHCAQGGLAQVSTPERDLLAQGFIARTRAEELRFPSYTVDVLVAMEDVTAKVQAATAGLDEKQANEARKQMLTRLEKESEDAARKDPKTGPLYCQSVTLYAGGQYFVYKYKRYDDVRLVFAPEIAIAAFGGDPDNFQYPRWCLDMSLLRVYENGRPARTPNYLAMNFAGPAEGDPVFVSGHPGRTERLLTVDQLKTLRDVQIPLRLMAGSELRGRLIQYGKTGAEPYRVAQDPLLFVENGLKVLRKELDALHEDNLFNSKRIGEQDLRSRLARDAEAAPNARTAWSSIARAQLVDRSLYPRRYFLENPRGYQGDLLGYARDLVRAAAEREKPNETRLREYTEGALPRVRQRLLAPSPVYPDREKLMLSMWLERMREWLGPDAAVVKKVLGSDSPEAIAARLVDGTKLADVAVRTQLWEGGRKAVEATDDPLIAFMRTLDPEARAVRRQYEDEVEAPVAVASEKIAAARFKAYGTSIYPDATGTLRLNYGSVQGWDENGPPVSPFTSFRTLLERVTGHDPFALPPSWLAARAKLDLDTPFNLCTSNDIVGGNSGSPLVNTRGELVGLLFDGNIHSISGAYWFDAEKNRAVAVHPAAIKEALDKVYGATAILKELSGPAPPARR